MNPSGKVSFGTLLLFTLLGGAIYGAVLYVPLYVDNLDVKEAVDVAHNISGRNPNDGVLRYEIRERTSRMGQHWEYDQYGRAQLKPGLGLTDEQIIIEHNPVTSAVRIEVRYERPVVFKPSSYTRTVRFNVVKEGVPPR
jgi:hypothetical protein